MKSVTYVVILVCATALVCQASDKCTPEVLKACIDAELLKCKDNKCPIRLGLLDVLKVKVCIENCQSDAKSVCALICGNGAQGVALPPVGGQGLQSPILR